MNTPLISSACAARIWTAHREIEAAEKLLVMVKEDAEKNRHANPLDPSPGRRYQLGVPLNFDGASGHRLLDVSPALAIAVCEAHIVRKRAELAEASLAAKIELAASP